MSESESAANKSRTLCCLNPVVEYEDGLKVCVNCGQVFNKSDQQLTNDPTQEYSLNYHSNDVKSYVANNPRFPNRFPVGKRHNTEDIDRLVFNLSLGAEVKIQALSRYKDMIVGHFHHSSKSTKKILAAICVYTALVNEKTPVTIGHICNTVGCSSSEFNKVYNQVFKEYPNYRCEQMPIESLVSVTISETTINQKEKKLITEKVKKILELLRECWLVEGRTPVHIIFAATFMAWKTINPYERRKVNLTDFCRTVGIEYKQTTSQRVNEMFNAIKILPKSIPFPVGHTINKNNIGIYLDSILEYKSSLIYDFNQKFRGISKLTMNGTNNGTLGEDPNSKTREWMSVFKRKANPKTIDSNGSQTSAKTSTKSDEEISDTEIDMYLRDEKEIKFIKKLKKFADFCEDKDNK